MPNEKFGYAITILAASLLLFPQLADFVTAEQVPEWVKNTALWYAEGTVSENEFLNAIKFLIENEIIVLNITEKTSTVTSEPKSHVLNVIIPNGNSDMGNVGFYLPLNAEIGVGTTVVWINNDAVPHTIQSQNVEGKIIGHFNSAPLYTGERFAHTFDESGVYNYFCTLHPWRVGLVTVN
jgi:plastocyanin